MSTIYHVVGSASGTVDSGIGSYEESVTWIVGSFTSMQAAIRRRDLAQQRVDEIRAVCRARGKLPRIQQIGLPSLDTSSQHDHKLPPDFAHAAGYTVEAGELIEEE